MQPNDYPALHGDHLRFDLLRQLTLDPHEHPRRQPHLSAASALVCALNHAYVIGDDELHVGAYRDRASPGAMHRVAEGRLPRDPAKRKKRKRDFEALLWWRQEQALVGFGSGSRTPRRDDGFVLGLNTDGTPRGEARRIDLSPLYDPLRERYGSINIEGAFVAAGDVRLVNRGGRGGAGNLVLAYSLRDLAGIVAGRPGSTTPALRSIQSFELGDLDGVALGFTDAAAVPGGRGSWVYSAAAEASDNSWDDGACRGSVVGLVSRDGHVRWQRRLGSRTDRLKVEGIDVQRRARDLAIFMTTDADDPTQAAWLLSARVRI